MNPRERVLAVLLISVIILGGGGFFGYQFVWSPWTTRTKELARLQKEYNEKQAHALAIEAEKTKLARWKLMSLPGDPGVARVEYEKYLNLLLAKHNIVTGREVTPRNADNKTVPTAGNKEPVYTRVDYEVHAYAPMASWVGFFKDFYGTGLMHQIKKLTMQRQMTTQNGRQDELDVHMTVEALIIAGAEKRPYLLPNVDTRLAALDVTASFPGTPQLLWAWASPGVLPTGMFPDPPRNYEAIAQKNIFLGRPTVVVERPDLGTPDFISPRFVHLTDITQNPKRSESTLYDVSTNRNYRLREMSGFNVFPFIKDGKGKAVAIGTVARIEERDVIYRADIQAEDAPSSRSAGAEGFFKLSKAERDQLVQDGVTKAEEADGVLRVGREYWDALKSQRVVRASTRDRDGFTISLDGDGGGGRGGFGGGGFGAGADFGGAADLGAEQPSFSSSQEVLRGKVLSQDGNDVYVRVEERYYNMHVGQSIADSLKKPLPREKVKELKVATTN